MWVKELSLTPHPLSVLMHEINHASLYILGNSGWKFDIDNEEPFTYHAQWMMKAFLEKFIKKRK